MPGLSPGIRMPQAPAMSKTVQPAVVRPSGNIVKWEEAVWVVAEAANERIWKKKADIRSIWRHLVSPNLEFIF